MMNAALMNYARENRAYIGYYAGMIVATALFLVIALDQIGHKHETPKERNAEG